MLAYLYIENFTLIEKLALDCQTGMTVITGETGAGKSILLDALQLALGARAESTLVVRPTTARCEITATFDIQHNTSAKSWLLSKDIPFDNECVLRRSITAEGRSRCFINEKPVTLQSLRFLGTLLVNIHGQHAHQSLLQKETQQLLVDNYGDYITLTTEVNALFHQWQKVKTALINCEQQLKQRESKLDFLRYQTEELSNVTLTPEELVTLEADHKKLSKAEQHIQIYEEILSKLSGNHHQGVLSQLEQMQQLLPDSANTIKELLETAVIQIKEAIDETHTQISLCEISPQKLQQMESCLTKMHDLARKHRVKITELPALREKLAEELAALEEIDKTYKALGDKLAQLAESYREKALMLREARKKAAKKMAAEITARIQTLGMPNGKFVAELLLNPEDAFSPQGLEKVVFLVSTNPGLPLQPLSKVASGGELSRISLAIQLIASKHQALPTLIFDEVDVGIGGNTAAIVGQEVRKLSENAQVICITHLPQVAALGHQHWRVVKKMTAGETITEVDVLFGNQKVQEIARMLGGLRITEKTLAHARELLAVS